MGDGAPTPETSVSVFVAALVVVTGLVIVLTLLVVRRHRRPLLTFTVGLVTLVVLGLGTAYATLPPQLGPLGGESLRCPYDRVVWSNMRPALAPQWLTCRHVARVQLAGGLLATAALTAAAGAGGVQLASTRTGRRPTAAPPAPLPTAHGAAGRR
jgi:hypothetical protein